MPNIVVSNNQIAGRVAQCRNLLKPLLPNPNSGGPGIQKRGGSSKIAYGAHGGSPPGNIRDWRFQTFKKNFFANYIEVWKSFGSSESKFFLQNVALTIYKYENPPGGSQIEYIGLHCEPEIQPNPKNPSSNTYIYKRSPHFHVEVAEDPIPKSHFAVAHYCIDDVLSSSDSIFEVIGESIILIREEVLEKV